MWLGSQSPTISCTKSTLCLAYEHSPLAEIFYTLIAFPFPLFFGDQVCVLRIKTRDKIRQVKLTPLRASSQSPIFSSIKSTISVQPIKTVQQLKHFTNSLHLYHRLKTNEEICWVKLTPLWVSPQLPFLNSLLNLSSLTTQRRRKNLEIYFVYIFQAHYLNCIIFMYLQVLKSVLISLISDP